MLKCKLCDSIYIKEIAPEKDPRKYFHCDSCFLIFVHPDFHLSREAEKSRYELHNNGLHQPGYVKFLNQIIEPTLPFLHSGMVGLDYGCGPVPTLSKLMLQQGIKCHDYDPIFGFEHPEDSYDFIFASECFEHFYKPYDEIKKIISLLKPQGHLCIMTERWKTLDQFNHWYYKNDPTHVNFFHLNTFTYLKEHLKLEILYQDKNRAMILKKLRSL